MKNILILNGYYFPSKKYGGPSTSIKNMMIALNSDYNFFVIARNHDYGDKIPFENIKDSLWYNKDGGNVIYLKDKDYNYKTIKCIIKEKKINLIYNSGFYLRKIKNPVYISRKLNIPLIIAPKGELNLGALSLKSSKKHIYLKIAKLFNFYKYCYFHTTSNEETEALINYLKIKEANIQQIPNFSCNVKSEINVPNNDVLNVLSVGRICKIKNLLTTLKYMKKIKFRMNFDIYGMVEDLKYYELCLKESKELPKNINVTFKGSFDNSDLKSIYSRYDLMISLTLGENYGQAISESLSIGCPVLISKGTTPWDDVDSVAGYAIDLSDEKRFISILNKMNKMSIDEKFILRERTIKYITKKSNLEVLKSQYRLFFDNI